VALGRFAQELLLPGAQGAFGALLDDFGDEAVAEHHVGHYGAVVGTEVGFEGGEQGFAGFGAGGRGAAEAAAEREAALLGRQWSVGGQVGRAEVDELLGVGRALQLGVQAIGTAQLGRGLNGVAGELGQTVVAEYVVGGRSSCRATWSRSR
jgi:hypothetical protein